MGIFHINQKTNQLINKIISLLLINNKKIFISCPNYYLYNNNNIYFFFTSCSANHHIVVVTVHIYLSELPSPSPPRTPVTFDVIVYTLACASHPGSDWGLASCGMCQWATHGPQCRGQKSVSQLVSHLLPFTAWPGTRERWPQLGVRIVFYCLLVWVLTSLCFGEIDEIILR